ncbi:MAG TPA: hypothetical protein P5267_00375 [Patescibacteria group bacterium]|nr:hypothetical protein [Patescibacteria group bacterium]
MEEIKGGDEPRLFAPLGVVWYNKIAKNGGKWIIYEIVSFAEIYTIGMPKCQKR